MPQRLASVSINSRDWRLVRLPRPVALVSPMDTGNRADRPLEGKPRIIAFAMADDLTEARRQLIARSTSSAALVERSIAAAQPPRAAAAFVATSFASAR